jgi:competence protein ComEA
VISINVAPVKDLRKLPCIGKKRANSILAYRNAHGPFRQLQSLRNVAGIGPKMLSWLAPYLIFQLNINQATLRDLEALSPLAGGLGEAIYRYRRQHGPFQNLEQLLRVPGLGRTTLERIRPFLSTTSPIVPSQSPQSPQSTTPAQKSPGSKTLSHPQIIVIP